MLMADKRDYRMGYKKHYELYKRLREDNSAVNSRRLLLIYSVECGLKYMLLSKWREENMKRILEGKDERKRDIITSHNMQRILKELGQLGVFKFPQLETVHKNHVVSETYHQIYRYCIRIQDKGKIKEEELEVTLKNVACWIEERM